MLSDVNRIETVNQYRRDFDVYASAEFTDTNSGSSPPAVAVSSTAGSAQGGWLKIPTKASAANDYRSLSTGQIYEFSATSRSPVVVEAKFKITEAATNSSSWYFGLTSVLTTGFLDSTGTPPTSFSGAVIYKKTGSAAIWFMASNGSAQSTPVQIGTFKSGTPILLTINFSPNDLVTGLLRATVNGAGDPAYALVQDTPLVLSGLAVMYLSAGLVCSTASAETMYLDYWGSEVARI